MKPCCGINAAPAHEDAHEVEDEVEEKKRHLNVVFIGHVGKLSLCTAYFVSTIFQGQLDMCTFTSIVSFLSCSCSCLPRIANF
jgi:predicted metal-dependent TIM-barrel fold hydrolase